MPTAKRILTAAEAEKGAKARVWDARTGKPLTDWFAYDDEVKSAQFSRDGKRIATVNGYVLLMQWRENI
jgi:WD40 repeat protein